MDPQVAKYFAAAFVMSMGAISSGFGEAWIGKTAMEGMARNPKVIDKLFTNMIVAQAIDESTAIYSLVTALIILFV